MFPDKAKQILEVNGWEKHTVADLLHEWQQFTKTCKTGYQMNLFEYENDLGVRAGIELILNEEKLLQSPEYEGFTKFVTEIDTKFKELLHPDFKRPDRSSWWEQGIPKRAGKELVNDLSNIFGYKIEAI